MYVSALARAKENTIIGRDGLLRLIDSESSAILAEYGYVPPSKEELSPEERNLLLDEAVALRFDEIEAALPAFDGEEYSIVTPLRYPYDCNNIKWALKCAIRGIDPDGSFFSLGTLSPEAAAELASGSLKKEDVKPYRKSRTKGLPANMSAAVKEAREAYASTKNPRIIDLILDRACYADMLLAAEAMGVPFLTDYVKLKIDSTNILTALRIYRMYGDNTARPEELIKDALLSGGMLDASALSRGRRSAFELIRRDARFERAAALIDTDSLSDAERIIDNVVSNFIISSRRASFGAEVPLGFLLGLELSVKNIRIVMAGKDARLDGATIRERMRDNYA